MTERDALLAILVMALVTAAIRYLPFLIFRRGTLPRPLAYFGGVLPGAIMAMLVVYCFRSTPVLSYPYGIPELIAAAVVVLTYLWKKNTLISIGLGTVLYMLLIQLVFH